MHTIFSNRRTPFRAIAVSILCLAPSVVLAAPLIGQVSPATAEVNVPVTFTTTVSGSYPIETCRLYVDLADVGAMSVANGVASALYTFTAGGSRIAFVYCRDTYGGRASGPNTSIWVSGQIVSSPPLSSPPPPPVSSPAPVELPAPVPTSAPLTTTLIAPGTLIKLACAAKASSDDPCRAIYYVGQDGKRHAFPNEHVYFTWYSGFDSVVTVASDAMSSLTLGKNVTYRPGQRMVKFTTVNKVYAVSRGGVLRWVTSEAVAQTLYGTDWNKKIDDIPDVFFTNYSFGTDVASDSDYLLSTEAAATTTIDANF